MTWTCSFHAAVLLAVVAPFLFVLSIWREAHLTSDELRQANWITPDSRDMYLDIFKTVSSAGTIAAALVSTVISTSSTSMPAARLSAKISVTSFIVSTIFSLVTIVSLSRFYDRARTRFVGSALAEKVAAAGRPTDCGKLLDSELFIALAAAFFALAGSGVGFLYLGRIVFVA